MVDISDKAITARVEEVLEAITDPRTGGIDLDMTSAVFAGKIVALEMLMQLTGEKITALAQLSETTNDLIGALQDRVSKLESGNK